MWSTATGSRDLLSENGVTFMQATPATWRLLSGSRVAGFARSQDSLWWRGGTGGTCSRTDASCQFRVECLWPDRDYDLVYVYRVTGREEGAIPIGRPIANTSIYILGFQSEPSARKCHWRDLHRRRRPCARLSEPSGANGRAVRCQPDWSEPVFPGCIARATWVASVPMARLSIWAAWTAKSSCAVFAIELGEIESVLASHATLQEAVVIVTGEGEQQKLSAYVVVNDGKEAPIRRRTPPPSANEATGAHGASRLLADRKIAARCPLAR